MRLSQQIDDMLTLWPENGTRRRWPSAASSGGISHSNLTAMEKVARDTPSASQAAAMMPEPVPSVANASITASRRPRSGSLSNARLFLNFYRSFGTLQALLKTFVFSLQLRVLC